MLPFYGRANVFIDFIEAGLLEEFFRLPWKIHTTDFVLDELKDSHQKETKHLVEVNQRLPMDKGGDLIRKWTE